MIGIESEEHILYPSVCLKCGSDTKKGACSSNNGGINGETNDMECQSLRCSNKTDKQRSLV